MPNLRGASPVGRDDGGRLCAARTSSGGTRGQAEQDWDAGRSRQITYDRGIIGRRASSRRGSALLECRKQDCGSPFLEDRRLEK